MVKREVMLNPPAAAEAVAVAVADAAPSEFGSPERPTTLSFSSTRGQGVESIQHTSQSGVFSENSYLQCLHQQPQRRLLGGLRSLRPALPQLLGSQL